jgi:hypothetical protein
VPDRELLVRILGDDRDLQRTLSNTDRRLTAIDNRTAAFGKNITQAFAVAGIAVGTSELFRLAGDAVDAASSLNEQLSRTRVVLGESADGVIDWSETTAQAFGISQRAALQATATFAGLFKTVGVQEAQAARLSQALVELAADLASLQDTSVEEALTALRSGLAGEAEPLRRFNIFLSEARVQQEAFAVSGKTAASQLTNQEKALARYNIILRDSVVAQDNFKDTSGELANQQRILTAQIEELEAAIGQVLIPTMTDFVGTLNDAAAATEELIGFLQGLEDLSPIELSIDIPVTLIFKGRTPSGIGDLFDKLGDEIGDGLESLIAGGNESIKNLEQLFRGEGGRGLRFFPSPVEDAVDQAVEDTKDRADDTEKKTKDLKKAEARRKKAFDEFIKGQGLKLDTARLTKTLDDDLAVLRAIEAAILRRIASEGRTFKLASQLVAVRQQIAGVLEDQAAAAKQAGEDAFNAAINAINLDLDMAKATKSFADDQAALRALEQAILRRIASEGQTTDLMRQLFQVRQEQAAVAKQLADQRRQARQSQQFEAIGLTAEGQERTPGIGALRRRGRGLIDELKASGLDEDQVATFVQRISVIFTDQFDKAGREVRQAILQLFQTINQALDQGTKAGPLTQTTALRTKKILAGLGLSPEEINALRGRLSSFNSGGVAPAGFLSPGVNAPSGGFAAPVVESTVNVTVTLDGQKVGKAVTKEQQKAKRRNPRQKRGPNRNI